MNNVQKAIEVFNQGGVVVFPTDTAFGIGCRIDKKASVERLFRIRKRPLTQAVPVLVDSMQMASEYFQKIPKDVKEKLINSYWPGALTIILPCKKEKVLPLVRGGGDTIGIRMPNHNVLLNIISSLSVPILGPSANFHGEKTPYFFKELDKKLVNLCDFVLEGEVTVKNSSTVIDCSKNPWQILRRGAVNITI